MNPVLKKVLDGKAADRFARLDARRTPGHQGHGVGDEEGEADSGSSMAKDSAFNFNSFGGFYQESQRLACNAGRKMRSDRRGLPPGYAQGPTWARAAGESS